MERITTRDFDKVTLQQIFDQTATHLMKQGRRSTLPEDPDGRCLYRQGTLMCAAGPFIHDEDYTTDMENVSWKTVVKKFNLNPRFQNDIQALQEIHDEITAEDWEYRLREFAEANHLEFNHIPTLKIS